MKIIDLLQKEGINLGFNNMSKNQCIDQLVNLMYNTGNIENKEIYKKAILDREALSTTGIGDGIAIPHGKSSTVKKASLVAAVCRRGIDYNSLDGEPAKLFFMIAVPESGDDLHLEVLARLSTILMDNQFKEKLINCTNKEEFLKLIDEKEKEKFKTEEMQVITIILLIEF
jgi:PTS system fructose-specific IIC component